MKNAGEDMKVSMPDQIKEATTKTSLEEQGVVAGQGVTAGQMLTNKRKMAWARMGKKSNKARNKTHAFKEADGWVKKPRTAERRGERNRLKKAQRESGHRK